LRCKIYGGENSGTSPGRTHYHLSVIGIGRSKLIP